MQLHDKSAAGLDRYIIGEYLGQGTTSDAFKVSDAVSKKEYVLKQMSLESMSNEERLRAKKEILVMNDVDHPNIIKFRESFSGDNSVNIIMEYCEYTLEELIERQQREGNPFPEDVIIEWMAELLCSLAYLHHRRIVHRDIKTSNIFLTERNHIKLGDFGVCTILTNATVAARSVIGTPLYFSPEVCDAETYDERSDVWSLGVVFYEMCTLRRPFEADHLPGLIQKILTEQVAPFETGLDARFEEIVRNMLSKDPRDRPTAQDLIDNHLVVPPSHPSHPSQKPSRSRLIQQYYGPELVFKKDKETKEAPSKKEAPEAILSAKEPREHKKNVVSVKRKKMDAAVDRTPAKNVGKVLSLEERNDALQRIKCANSKINMVELRQNMLRKRSELFGEDNVSGDVPVIIEIQRSLLAAKDDSLASPLQGPSNEPSEASTTIRPKSSFLEDVASVIERHSSDGAVIDIDQLDDVASLLCQYKLMNYGLR